jgi:hypothetical protein
VGDRRETRGTNWRVREAVGVRQPRPQHQDQELVQLLESGDFSQDTIQRLAEALGQTDPTAKRFSAD